MSSKKAAATHYQQSVTEASPVEQALYDLGFALGQSGQPRPLRLTVDGREYGRYDLEFDSARLGWRLGAQGAVAA